MSDREEKTKIGIPPPPTPQEVGVRSFEMDVIIVLAVAFGWWTYIYITLGHVCPATFILVWHAALLETINRKKRLPSALSVLLSFISVPIFWYIAFYKLHPPQSHLKVITLGPSIMLIMTFIAGVLLQMLLSNLSFEKIIARIKGKSKGTGNHASGHENNGDGGRTELHDNSDKTNEDDEPINNNTPNKEEFMTHPLQRLDGFINSLNLSIGLIVAIYYMTSEHVKEMVWNDEPQYYADTTFEVGAVYYIFYFIAAIMLFSSICGLLAILLFKKHQTLAIHLRVLSYTLLGMLIVGTFSMYLFLRFQGSKVPEKKNTT